MAQGQGRPAPGGRHSRRRIPREVRQLAERVHRDPEDRRLGLALEERPRVLAVIEGPLVLDPFADAHEPDRQGRARGRSRAEAECSAFRATLGAMPTPPLSLRLGRDGLRELDAIARRRGITRAEAARQAIAETAERERRRRGLAAEVRALIEDSEYVREAREVAGLMEQLRGSG